MAEVKLPDPKEWANRLHKDYPDGEYPAYVSFYMGEVEIEGSSGILERELAEFQRETLRAVAHELRERSNWPGDGFSLAADRVERMAEEVR